MKLTKFVGDRVRVFAHYGPYEGIVIETNVISKNRYRTATGLLRIKTDIGEEWTAHPRQCVRLKVRPRMERWYAAPDAKGQGEYYASCADALGSSAIHLVELRKGEVIVSKERLARAWSGIGFTDKDNLPDLDQYVADRLVQEEA